MIIEQETSRYNVKPANLIEDSFAGAYNALSDAPVVQKPDTLVTIFSVISMILVCGMCALTVFDQGSFLWWGIVAIAFALIGVYIVYKHIKKLGEYKKANAKGTKKFDYHSEYVSIFPDDLPQIMPANEFASIIAPLQGSQKRDVYNNAIRDLLSSVNRKNTPNDIMCKNITVFGKIMDKPKKRYYMKGEDGKIVIYDADFMNPAGELVIDEANIVSFGYFSQYDSSINKSGSKVKQDAIVIEIATSDDIANDGRIYIEAYDRDLDKIKKLIGSRKMK